MKTGILKTIFGFFVCVVSFMLLSEKSKFLPRIMAAVGGAYMGAGIYKIRKAWDAEEETF